MLQLQRGQRYMIKAERDRCAERVEQIRQIARSKPLPPDYDEAIGERCDQLLMKLQPITIRYPKDRHV